MKLLSIVVLSCSRSPAPNDANLVAEALTVERAAAGAIAPVRQQLSFANFRRDKLEYCSDLVLTIQPPQGAKGNWTPEKSYDLREAMEDSGVELKKRCREQFASRIVLATCKATLEKTKERSKLEILEQYYDSQAITESDRHMQECLHLGGEWQVAGKEKQPAKDNTLDEALRHLHESTTIN